MNGNEKFTAGCEPLISLKSGEIRVCENNKNKIFAQMKPRFFKTHHIICVTLSCTAASGTRSVVFTADVIAALHSSNWKGSTVQTGR